VDVKLKNGDSLTLGLGMLIEQAASASTRVYADIEAKYDVLDDSAITASGFDFDSGVSDSWGNVALGASLDLGSGVTGYLQGEVGSALDSSFGDSMSYGAKLGFRVDF